MKPERPISALQAPDEPRRSCRDDSTRPHAIAERRMQIDMQIGAAKVQQSPAIAEQRKITAIGILLDPDGAMIEHAQAANAGLQKNYPKGFALGGAHAPHITVLQRYVYTADLSKLYAAAGKVLANENVNSGKLKAIEYDYIAQQTIGIGAFVVESTADLLRLQRDLVDAVAPFTAPIGTTAAFVTTPQEPDINQPTNRLHRNVRSRALGRAFHPARHRRDRHS